MIINWYWAHYPLFSKNWNSSMTTYVGPGRINEWVPEIHENTFCEKKLRDKYYLTMSLLIRSIFYLPSKQIFIFASLKRFKLKLSLFMNDLWCLNSSWVFKGCQNGVKTILLLQREALSTSLCNTLLLCQRRNHSNYSKLRL